MNNSNERIDARTVGLYPKDWQILAEHADRLAQESGAARANRSAALRTILQEWQLWVQGSERHEVYRRAVLEELAAEAHSVSVSAVGLYPSQWELIAATAQRLAAESQAAAAPDDGAEPSNSLAMRVILREWHAARSRTAYGLTFQELATIKQLAQALQAGTAHPLPAACPADADVEV